MNSKPGLGDLMKKAQEMEVTGQSGGGLVKIVMSGQHFAKRVTLDPTVLKEEKTVLEDLIAAAINDATDKIEKGTRDKMSGLSGIKLPDGFELPK
jgi:DNA-binding YbaB/EbfC family protein